MCRAVSQGSHHIVINRYVAVMLCAVLPQPRFRVFLCGNCFVYGFVLGVSRHQPQLTLAISCLLEVWVSTYWAAKSVGGFALPLAEMPAL